MSTTSRTGEGRTALVVGGTGPTGPDIVNGLVERGYKTSIFHSGRHEVPLPMEVEHIHGDPHFQETIAEAIGDRKFDVVIAQYGRLRHLVEHFLDRTSHIIAIGGMTGPLLDAAHPDWGPLGRPSIVRENDRLLIREPTPENKLGYRIAEASRHFFEECRKANVATTYIVYPPLYGPRQPGSQEWSIVKRINDGRREIILPDNGLRIETRAFVHNVSQAPLLAADNPTASNGKTYVVTDEQIYSTRQRVEGIVRHMDASIELVNMPYELATPTHPFYRLGPDHRAGIGDNIREELGYKDRFTVAEAIEQTVDWLQSNSDAVPEIEKQLNDPFDYDYEDQLIAWWRSIIGTAPEPSHTFEYSHMYRHPTKPDSTPTSNV